MLRGGTRLTTVGAILIALGCCACMCYPPWASGALLAAVLVLAAWQLVVLAARRGEHARSPLAVWIAAGALLVWLGIVATRSECSEFSLRQVVWAVSFVAAAVLGAGAGQGRQRRLVLYVVAAVGVVLSLVGLAHWLGGNVMEHADYGNRLSAFTNPNRYAVLLTVCWSCGAGALAEARADLEAARRLNPYEHRYCWVAGIVEVWAGDNAAAAAFGEEAVARAPHNLALREWLGRLYAARIPKDAMGEPRDAAVAQAMRHLQVAFEGAGKPQIIEFLRESDCTPAEIGELWPGQSAEARLRRADFFLAERQLHLVDRELRGGPPEEPALNGQYHLLQGALAFRRDNIETGVAEWQTALKAMPSDAWVKRGPWLAGRLPDLDGPIAAQMVDAFGDHLSRLPALTERLAWALVRARNWLPANRLLEKSAHQSTSLYAAWAEVTLGLKDLPEAESRAGMVQQRGGTAWAQWRTGFERRLEAQRKPRR